MKFSGNIFKIIRRTNIFFAIKKPMNWIHWVILHQLHEVLIVLLVMKQQCHNVQNHVLVALAIVLLWRDSEL